MAISKRKLTVTSLALTMAFGLTACAGQSGEATPDAARDMGPVSAGMVKAGVLDGATLAFASSGGVFQEGHMKAVWNPFAEESGAVMLEDAFDSAKLKAMVESGQVDWDIVNTTQLDTEIHCGDLYQKLDLNQIDISEVPEGLISNECMVPSIIYGDVLTYNTDLFGDNPPTSLADFFDTKKFPGKRGINMTTYVDPQILEVALLADGVDTENLKPDDIERAIDKFNSLGSDLIGWTSGAQSQQQLESGEVVMSIVWSGRGYAAQQAGAPVAPMWDNWMVKTDSLAVPMGVKDPQAAFAGVNYFLGAKQQAKSTELTSYAPVNVNAEPAIDAELALWLATDHIGTGHITKLPFWIDNYDALASAWAGWVSGTS